MSKLLLFGYGNPGRGDDALGLLAIDYIHQSKPAGIDCLSDMQLLIEHATDLQQYDQVIFIDADISCQEPFEFMEIHAKRDSSYTSHTLTPAALLFVYQQIFNKNSPESYLLRIRGYHFELGESLSAQASVNLQEAIKLLQQWQKP